MILKTRLDYRTIGNWIQSGSKVLDFGCGDGGLLRYLADERDVEGYGMEIEDEKVLQCISNGVNVIQGDLEKDSSFFDSGAFDYVILSLTLQAVRHTESVVLEMLRIGRECIVTFPNFGFWFHRYQVILGNMPVSNQLPFQWYNTPNVHLFTVNDFENFCAENSLHIMDRLVLDSKGNTVNFLPNFLGSLAFYRFKKNESSDNDYLDFL